MKGRTRVAVGRVLESLIFSSKVCSDDESALTSNLDSGQLMSEPAQGELGAALTQLVAALEHVSLDGLEPGDRDLVELALLAARTALQRATSQAEPFPMED